MAVFPSFQDLRRFFSNQRDNLELQLNIIDLTLNYLIFTPLIVLHNHSITSIIRYTLLQSLPPYLHSMILIGTGVGIQLTLAFWQRRIKSYIATHTDKEIKDIIGTVAPSLYDLTLSIGCICHIQGIDALFDYVCDLEDIPWTDGVLFCIKATVTSLIIIWALKGARNTLAAPLCLDINVEEDDFTMYTTLFTIEPDESVESMLDCFVTIGVVTSFINLLWSAIWSLLDLVLVLHVRCMSALFSLLIGYTLCLAILLSQNKTIAISAKLEKQGRYAKHLFENVFYLISTVGVVAVWRGLWLTFDIATEYFPMYHRGKDVTTSATCFLSFFILSFAYLTASLPHKGFDRDGEDRHGEGVHLFTSYLGNLIDFSPISRINEEPIEPETKPVFQAALHDIPFIDDEDKNAEVNAAGSARKRRPRKPPARPPEEMQETFQEVPMETYAASPTVRRIRSLKRKEKLESTQNQQQPRKPSEQNGTSASKKVSFDPLPPSRRSLPDIHYMADDERDSDTAVSFKIRAAKRPLLLSKEEMVMKEEVLPPQQKPVRGVLKRTSSVQTETAKAIDWNQARTIYYSH